MIGYLQGTITHIFDHHVILMTAGVGYLVKLNNDLLSRLSLEQSAEFFIHTQVKEDDISLFGFLDISQLKLFQQLISVSGIGAKTAMGILDMPIHLVKRALLEEDLSYLSQAPGLGKKTAARLVLELKGKIDSLEIQPPGAEPLNKSIQEEALQALLNLGYDKGSVIRFLNTTDSPYETAEELVMVFLQNA